MKIRGLLGKKEMEDAIAETTLELERAGVISQMSMPFRLTFEHLLL